MTWLLVLALTALPLAPAITSTPGVTCPSPRELETALAGLLPDPAAISVQLRANGDALLVRIDDRQGRFLGERRLRPVAVPPATCAERTQEVAVVVAAAAGRLRGPGALAPPEVIALAPLPPVAPPPRTAARSATSEAVQPAPARSPDPAPPARPRLEPPPRRPAAPVTVADTVVRAGAVPMAPVRRPPALGVSLGASMTGGTVAASAAAELTLRIWPRLPISVGALYVADHTLALGAGQAVWWRVGPTASLAYHVPLGARWFLESGAAAAATALYIEGQNVPSPAHSLTFDPAGSLLLRVGHRGDRTDLWLGALLSRWLRPQGAYIQGSSDEVDLPRWEVNVGLGGRFDLGVTSAGART